MKKLFNKLFGGKTERDTDDVDGGVKKHIDRNAPKTIESTELTRFECEFALHAYVLNEEDNDFSGFFRLSAELSEGAVKVKYVRSRRYEGRIDEKFITDASLLSELEKVVREEDIASLNGIESFTSGLPDFYGASLNAEYASGEWIYTSNNQEIELPMSALSRFKTLFDEALIKARKENGIINPAVTPAVPDPDDAEDFDAGWMCGCGAINERGTEVCFDCGKEKPKEMKAECICGLKFYGKLPPFCPLCGNVIENKKD